MRELAVHPEEIERQRLARARRLALTDIPLLRVTGFTLLSIALFLHNRYLLGDRDLDLWGSATALMGLYTGLSWVVLHASLRYLHRDLTVVFLAADVVIWTFVIYVSGAEASWLYFILLMRVADQTQTAFRRSLAFAAWGTACYAAMLGWVVWVDDRAIDPAAASVKLIFIAVAGLYIALTARTAERRRTQLAEAMRLARELIQKADEQNRELEEARGRAEQASAAKSEFVANMSHELRTPLHGVIGMLQLAMQGEHAPRHRRQLGMAKRSAESLLATIDDILDFSKIEARKIDLEPADFSISDLLTETLKPLGVTAAARGLVLAGGVDPNVPDTAWGDPHRLKQILVNLVGNAIKFTEAGEIVVRVSRAGDSLLFEVADTGIGIAMEERERIFEPFEQADGSRSRPHRGTGLGLTIVARIVDAMGGTVELHSAPGSGSSFRFSVPQPPDRIRPTADPPAWRHALGGRSVLLVEPNPRSRALLADMLRFQGMTVAECASLTELPAERFECVITADEAIAMERAILITSPLETVLDDRLRVVRPVMERELLEAVATALGVEGTGAVQSESSSARRGDVLRVLVAEDDGVSQEFAAEALRSMGHRVSVASDGEEALRRMREQVYDLVLMDLQMPHLSGLEAARRYREGEPETVHTPIVALTAHTAESDRQTCLEAGMDSVLTKPIDLAQLQEVVRKMTRSDPILEAVGGNSRLLERVSDAFGRQSPELLAAMRAAVVARDGDALYRAAHTMKGAVSHFDGDPSCELARMIEQAAAAGDFARAAALIPRLESAVASLERRITAATAR